MNSRQCDSPDKLDLDCLVDPCGEESTTNRRSFLRTAGVASVAGAATGGAGCTETAAATDMPRAAAGPPLPTIEFGKYRISRLIAGANPIYGYSHFNSLFSAHMREYHTTGRVVSFLQQLERAGLSTWQASWSERLETDWKTYQDAGGTLQLLLLSKPTFNDDPALLKRAVERLRPLGVAQHGSMTKRLWDAGEMDKSLDYLKQVRDSGVMVGLSGHNPLEIEYAEEKGWDVDYYMTCIYEMNRTTDELVKLLGQRPLGEVYLPSDPPRMFRTIRQTSKPCLAYKALAAGRLAGSPEQIGAQLAMVYGGIKPGDALILGMYQRYEDQVGGNAAMVRRILTQAAS